MSERLRDVSAVILAGGHSRRMGRDKLLLPLGDGTLLSHVTQLMQLLFQEVVVVTREPQKHRQPQTRIVSDRLSAHRRCALVGIHAGLTAVSNCKAFVIGGDMPFVNPQLVRHLVHQSSDAWVTIPRHGDFREPLCAVYDVRCADPIVEQLERGEYKVGKLFVQVSVCEIKESSLRLYDPDLLSFFNVNSAEDYAAAQRHLRRSARVNSEQPEA